ncbi:MAG TPA: hypothetical protein VGJ60_09990 [Chloroflexota bacterium]
MVDLSSRYAPCQVLAYTAPDGRAVPYFSQRFLPAGSSLPLLQWVTVGQRDRLDWIATRALGDPLQAWHICDANDAMNPRDLVNVPGQRLRIPQPFPPGARLNAALPPPGAG